MTDILQQDIQYMAGVGPNRKKVLSEELGINTLGDLLQYYPYKHIDRSRIYTIHELTGDMPFVQVCGRILSFESFDMGHRKTRVVAHLSDGTWFESDGPYGYRDVQRKPSANYRLRYGHSRQPYTRDGRRKYRHFSLLIYDNN